MRYLLTYLNSEVKEVNDISSKIYTNTQMINVNRIMCAISKCRKREILNHRQMVDRINAQFVLFGISAFDFKLYDGNFILSYTARDVETSIARTFHFRASSYGKLDSAYELFLTGDYARKMERELPPFFENENIEKSLDWLSCDDIFVETVEKLHNTLNVEEFLYTMNKRGKLCNLINIFLNPDGKYYIGVEFPTEAYLIFSDKNQVTCSMLYNENYFYTSSPYEVNLGNSKVYEVFNHHKVFDQKLYENIMRRKEK